MVSRAFSFFPSILSFSTISDAMLPDSPSGLDRMLFGILLLSILLLYSNVNVRGYFLTLYVIKYTDFENKYPKFKKIINYFKNSNIVLIIIEIIFIVSILLGAIAICIILLYFK